EAAANVYFCAKQHFFMRRLSFLFLLFVGISFNSVAQNKQLTVEDAFLKPELNPTNLLGLCWIHNTHTYSFIHKNKLVTGSVSDNKKDTLFSLDELNKAYETAKISTVKRIP